MNRTRHTLAFVAGVLVGGRSRRMGRPKAMLRLKGGKTLVEHVVGVTSELVGEVVLLGPATPLPPALETLRVLPDAKPDHGPLGGLCSLLEHAADRWALLLACDMPGLASPVVRRILEHADPEHDAVVFRLEDRPDTFHACCALYHPRILPVAIAELGDGKGSLQRVLASAKKNVLSPTPDQARQLTNVNRPEDLEGML